MFGFLWLFVEEGAFLFDVFSWGEEVLPRAQAEALISQRVCAGDTGNVWVILFNVGSIICTTSTAENKEKLLSLKTLKAGLSLKNETERVITALYVWKDWLRHPASVLYLHWGICILSSLGKGMTLQQNRGWAWETWLRISLGLAEFRVKHSSHLADLHRSDFHHVICQLMSHLGTILSGELRWARFLAFSSWNKVWEQS